MTPWSVWKAFTPGRVFASALANAHCTPEHSQRVHRGVWPQCGAQTGQIPDYTGTIATVSLPLGLLGTVIGTVKLFGAFTVTGHDVAQFAREISVALYYTARGIVVAVPAMIFTSISGAK